MKRTATAVWQGTIKDGRGSLDTGSGALKAAPYSFKSRFENEPATNPEELLAAAHAGCFAMALSLFLGNAGHTPERLTAKATVSLEQDGGGFTITKSHLDLTARVPGISQAEFDRLANEAKANCPLSKVINAEITLAATLEA